jgi:hypothetical protein
MTDRPASPPGWPPPELIDGRTVWDRVQLDHAFSAIDGGEGNPLGEVL